QSVIETGDLVVNLDTKTVEVNHARVYLTGKEYQVLELLSLRKGTTLSKEMFLNHLYGGMDEPEIKIINVFMCKLRKKLAGPSNCQDYIETVWGRGYVLREPHAVEAKRPALVLLQRSRIRWYRVAPLQAAPQAGCAGPRHPRRSTRFGVSVVLDPWSGSPPGPSPLVSRVAA